MKYFKIQKVYVLMLLFILCVFLGAGCSSDSGDVQALIDAESDSVNPGTCTKDGPKVTLSNLPDGASNVPTDVVIQVYFSHAMNPHTIVADDTLTFTVREKVLKRPVDGTVTMDATNMIAFFTPDNPLDTDTEYTVTITENAETEGGQSLSCSYRWSFTTEE
jgi:hypothetical protein